MLNVGSSNLEKINVLDVIKFAIMIWRYDVATKIIANYFSLCKV